MSSPARLVLWATLLFCPVALWGQQTIFDVPSADVSGKGEWFYQHQTVARSWGQDRHWLQTNAIGFGLGRSFEIDGTWFNLNPKAPGESNGSLGFKWSPRLNAEEAKVPLRLVAGEMIQVRGTAPHPGNWAYLMLSAELPHSKTHLTGGVTSGTSVLFGEKTTGVLAGIEQHLTNHWMLQMDWFSGKHDLAYLIPGVVYRATPHWMISLGYQIPNRNSTGYGAIVFELTRIP